jgi:hypothetical protein
MTKTTKISSLVLLTASLLVPALATAQKPEDEPRGGGKAAEHRSDRAAERSNAQWQEEAKRGQDRAAEVREKDGDRDESEQDGDERSERGEKREKKRKEHSEGDEGREAAEDPQRERSETRERAAGDRSEAERGTRRKGEDSRGFWQRWFGDDEPAAQ